MMRPLQAMLLVMSLGMVARATEPSVKIDVSFPGANVEVLMQKNRMVELAPDLKGGRPWFYWCFEATVDQPGRVTFRFPERVAGFKDGAIGYQGPAISMDRGKTWKFLGARNDGGRQFHHDFEKPGVPVRFAVTIPYTEQNLKEFLSQHRANRHLKKHTLTTSSKGRDVELLQIGNPGPDRQAMIVTARHHAAETMASYVLEGFLDAAMSDSEEGKRFRERYALFAIPFVDKDGVEEGDQGKNRRPHDHNRDYGKDSIYPEVKAIKMLDKKHDFRYSLDFHCPTLVMKDHQVMYFVGPKTRPALNHQNVSEFAKWIKKGLPKKAPVGPMNWLRDRDKPQPMNSNYFGFKKNAIMAATLEFPFAPPGKSTDPASCREYGKVVLSAWVQTHFLASDADRRQSP